MGILGIHRGIFSSFVLVITFIDLAGHKKYMKTTVFGLAALHPDFAMLCVDAPTGVGRFSVMSKFFL
jgi:GTPase